MAKTDAEVKQDDDPESQTQVTSTIATKRPIRDDHHDVPGERAVEKEETVVQAAETDQRVTRRRSKRFRKQ